MNGEFIGVVLLHGEEKLNNVVCVSSLISRTG